MPTAKSSSLKDFSKKSDAVAYSVKERGALPMIDRGDIRQAISHSSSNIWASLPGAGYGGFERRKADSLIAKFKEAGGTVREIDV